MRFVLAALALALLAAPGIAQDVPSVVIMGIDGMDPVMLQRYIDEGKMPNFAALAREGAFVNLGTSVPPQSPVAWSNFITGMDPGGHGIFDFIHRDPATYLPVFSTASVSDPEKTLEIGDWILPLTSGETRLLRKGQAFWQVLDGHGIPYTVFRVPANFPPAEAKDRTLSGMGTPDLLGTYGMFACYTDDDIFEGLDISGGTIYPVKIQEHGFTDHIRGPQNTLRRDRPELLRRFDVSIDPENDAALVDVDGERLLLAAGEWSDWVRVSFDIAGPMKQLTGVCRFYLRSVRPYFHLYVTPVNIDPASPALPISTPSGYAKDVHDAIGPYYTQGMPEDTKALEAGVLTDAEFVAQTQNVMAERWRMLDTVLDGYRGGFMFFYVSTVDQSCHALWRNTDPRHPAWNDALGFSDRFEVLYREMDRMLGELRSRVPTDATVIVMSDHGFAPYYKKAHLNTWLKENGYLTLIRPGEMGEHEFFGNVFWRRTRAYGVGINGLYLNRLGREARGTVDADEVDSLLDEISARLLEWRDPETGEAVVTNVYRTADVYHGPETADAPDLIVGYNRGYRGSDESALGTLNPRVLTPNLNRWTGDHCMDHRVVPGVLLSNRSIAIGDPDLKDLPVTILRLYGIDRPGQMTGRNLFPAR